jgi:hypothetical protein
MHAGATAIAAKVTIRMPNLKVVVLTGSLLEVRTRRERAIAGSDVKGGRRGWAALLGARRRT